MGKGKKKDQNFKWNHKPGKKKKTKPIHTFVENGGEETNEHSG